MENLFNHGPKGRDNKTIPKANACDHIVLFFSSFLIDLHGIVNVRNLRNFAKAHNRKQRLLRNQNYYNTKHKKL